MNESSIKYMINILVGMCKTDVSVDVIFLKFYRLSKSPNRFLQKSKTVHSNET